MAQSQVNALYNCCISTPWVDVIKRLDAEANIYPTYLIGWKAEDYSSISSDFKNCFLQSVEDAWCGKGFPDYEYKFCFDKEILESISSEILIAIKMMDRLDIGRNNFPFSNRMDFFMFMLKHWMVILEQGKIDIIISPSIPHRVFDYILYIAAKIKNIKFLMFQMTPFGDSSFIIDDIDALPSHLSQRINSQDAPLRDDIADRIGLLNGSYQQAEPDYMKEQARDIKSNGQSFLSFNNVKRILLNPLQLLAEDKSYYLSRGKMPFQPKDPKYKLLISRRQNQKYLQLLKQELIQYYSRDISKKFVLVALHYEPEETTCPSGRLFYDQALIVEMLNDFLPDEYDIVIKEHKSQFNSRLEGAMGRQFGFYQRLKDISNRVKFVDVESDPFPLIERATATLTVTGTIGWESAIKGTPALVWGRAWYIGMPGVFVINSKHDLQENWSKIEQLKNNIDKMAIEDFHKNLQKYLIDAPHYKAYVNKSDRNIDKSVDNIFNGIQQYLRITETNDD